MANLLDLLDDGASRFARRPVLLHGGESMDHPTLRHRVTHAAQGLGHQGVQPGDRVMILARNRPEWLVTLFATMAVDAVAVPVNPALAAPEVGYIAGHCAPSVIFMDGDLGHLVANVRRPPRLVCFDVPGAVPPPDYVPWAAFVEGDRDGLPRPRAGGGDPALVFYTSGTTGRPKGVVLSHAAELFTARMVAAHFRIGPSDRVMVAGPLAFIYPLVINCLGAVAGGATVALQPRFHPAEVARAVREHRATVFMGVPTMFVMLLNWAEGRDADLSSLRYAISAGQNISGTVCARFEERFGVVIYDLWGMTEGTPITSYDPASEPRGRPESCGRALPGCEARVVDGDGRELPRGDEGEVVLRGGNMMSGYYGDPEATATTIREGWVHSGDLGRMDEDGYLYILGRMKDVIIRGGSNVYPGDVEDVLYGHPSVAECAVVGLPDELYGERVAAFVVMKASASAEELSAHCAARLAAYKVPVEFLCMDALPKGPTGKILKRVLRDRPPAARALG